MEKLKQYWSYISGVVILVLGILFYSKAKKSDSLESQLSNQKAKEATLEIDHSIKDQEKIADDAEALLKSKLAELERLRNS